MDLQRYLQTCMKDTVPALMKRINIATQRVLFLLDCTILPKEDIQLNTRLILFTQYHTNAQLPK